MKLSRSASLFICTTLLSFPFSLFAFFFLPPAGCPASALDRSADPSEGRFEDTWMAVMLQGKKVGYSHSEMTRTGDRIETRVTTYLRIQRGGVPLEIQTVESNTETLDGRPVSFANEMKMSDQPMKIRGTVADGKMTVVTEQFGVPMTQEVDYPQGALMPWAAHRETLKHEIKPGTKINLSVFMPDFALNVGVPTTTEILEQGSVEVMGKNTPGYKVKLTMVINGAEIVSTGWVDRQYNPLRQETSMMGMTFEMVACSEQQAKEAIVDVELMVDTLIPVGRSIDRDKAQSITFKIMPKSDKKLTVDIPETSMQKVVSRTDREVVFRVSRLDHAALRKGKDAAVPDSLQPFLKANAYITSNDPQVRQLATGAIEGVHHPYEQADRLRRKVSEVIEYKGLGVGFASAAEICRNKEGDCSEHGVLLAALARAAGIPSRLVCGLLYVPEFGGKENVLGFHMWAQLWINGRWVDMDSAWNQTDVDPTHIALATSSGEDFTVGSLISSAMLHINEWSVSIVKVEEHGNH